MDRERTILSDSGHPVCKALAANGWAVLSTTSTTHDSLAADVLSTAGKLGDIVPGRGGQIVELVVPESIHTARASSLSSKYGLQPLPLHTDTAHWIIPCRFLVLACLEPGPTPTPTFLLDSFAIRFSEREDLLCRSAVFAIRNGRRSFYGSILDPERPFVRLDPGCMTPISRDGVKALESFCTGRHEQSLQQHDWMQGDIMVLDNWRMLHGRGRSASTERGRILMRAMIK